MKSYTKRVLSTILCVLLVLTTPLGALGDTLIVDNALSVQQSVEAAPAVWIDAPVRRTIQKQQSASPQQVEETDAGGIVPGSAVSEVIEEAPRSSTPSGSSGSVSVGTMAHREAIRTVGNDDIILYDETVPLGGNASDAVSQGNQALDFVDIFETEEGAGVNPPVGKDPPATGDDALQFEDLSGDSGSDSFIPEQNDMAGADGIEMMDIMLDELEGFVPSAQDAPVPNLQATLDSGTGTIQVTWGAFSDPSLDSYVLYRNGTEVSPTFAPNEYSYTDSTVLVGETYTYSIVAMDAGFQPLSEVTFAAPVTVIPTGLTAVGNVQAVVNSLAMTPTVDVSWDAFVDASLDHYVVYRDGTPLNTAAGTTYQDTSAVAGETYTYSVVAVDISSVPISDMGYAAPVAVPAALSPVANVQAAMDDAAPVLTAKVTWDAFVDASLDHYVVYRDGTPLTPTVAAGTEEFEDTNVTLGDSYTYSVEAMDSGSTAISDLGYAAQLTITAPPALTPVANVQAAMDDAAPVLTAKITWDAFVDASLDHYVVYRDGTPLTPTVAAGTEEFEDTNVTLGDSYVYSVEAMDSGSTAISDVGYAASLTITAPPALTPVANVQAAMDDAAPVLTAKVTWDAFVDASLDHYVVYRDGTPLMPTVAAGTEEFEDTNVTLGDSYTYSVEAMNSGSTAISDLGYAAQLTITAPPALTPVANVQAAMDDAAPVLTAKVTWDAFVDASLDHYVVYRDGTPLTPTVAAGTEEFEDTNVTLGDSYTYSVEAMDSGSTAISDLGYAAQLTITAPPALTPVANVQAAMDDAAPVLTAKITWDAFVDASLDHYVVYRDGTPLTPTVAAGTEEFEDTNVTLGDSYIYSVEAMDSGSTAISDVGYAASLTITAPPLASVLNVQAAMDDAAPVLTAKITWDAFTDASLDHYVVYRDGTPLTPTVAAGTEEFEDTNVTLGGMHVYSVVAMDSGSTALSSAGAAPTLTITAPGLTAVANVQAAMDDAAPVLTAKITWDAFVDASLDHYVVYRDGTPLTPTVAAGTEEYEDTNVTLGDSYVYSVVAMDSASTALSNPGVAASLTITAPPALTPVANVQAAMDTTALTPTVEVTWDAFVDASLDHYVVYRDGTPLTPTVAAGTETYSDDTVTVGNTYTYSVVAMDSASVAISDEGLATPILVSATMQAIQNVQAAMDDAAPVLTAKVTWDAFVDASLDHYVVYRDGTPLTPTVAAGTEEFEDTTVSAGDTYTYSVVAMDSTSTAISQPGAATPLAVPAALLPVVGVQAQMDTAAPVLTVQLTWTAFADAALTHYEIYRNGTLLPTTVPAGTQAYDDTDVSVGDVLSYTVKAMNGATAISEMSAAAAITVTDPDAVTLLSAVYTNGITALAWSAVTGATGYEITRQGSLEASPTTIATPGTAVTSYNDQDAGTLAADTYTYTVTELGGGSSDSKAVAIDPSITEDLNLTAQIVGSQVNLAWSQITHAQNITVTRNGSLIQTLPGTATSYTDDVANLHDGSNTYVVTAIGLGTGVGSISDSASVTKAALSVSGTYKNGITALTWSNVPSATGYVVLRDSVQIATVPAESPEPATYTYEDADAPAVPASPVYTVVSAGVVASGSATVAYTASDVQSLQLTAVAGDQGVTLAWQAIDGATQYKILRDGVELVASISGTSYLDEYDNPTGNLDPNTQYEYTVVVLDGIGNNVTIEQDETVTTKDFDTSIASPQNLQVAVSATPGTYGFDITWDNDASATGYRVTRVQDGQSWDVTASSYTDDTAKFLTDYDYTVVTIVGASASLPSSAQTPSQLIPPAVDAPATATWDLATRSIIVEWPTYVYMGRVDGIMVSYTGSDTSLNELPVTSGTTISIPVDGTKIIPGGTYSFMVAPYVGAVTGSGINTNSETVPTDLAPGFTDAEAIDDTSIKLTWNNYGLVPTALEIKWREAGDTTWAGTQAITPATSTDYTVTGLTALTAYEFGLFADMGSGLPATEDDLISGSTTPITALNLAADTSVDGQVTLTWDYPGMTRALAAEFRVVRISPTGNPADAREEIVTGLTWVDNQAIPLVATTYEVYSRIAGTATENPVPATVTATATLGAPTTATAALQADGSVNVSWDAVTGANVYRIEYAEVVGGVNPDPSIPWTVLYNVSGQTDTTVPAATFTKGKTYQFKVYAGVQVSATPQFGTGYAVSNSVAIVDLPYGVTAVAAGGNQATIGWQMDTDTTDGYTVYYAQAPVTGSSTLSSESTSDGTARSLQVSGLLANTAYEFFVVPGTGPAPSDVTGYASATLTLHAPVITSVTETGLATIDMAWTYGGSASDTFQIYVAEDSATGTYAPLGAPVTGNAVTGLAHTLQADKFYYFKVAAINASSVEGPLSDPFQLSTMTTPMPANVTVVPGTNGSVTVNWDMPSGDSTGGYTVYYTDDPSDLASFKSVTVTNPATHTASITGLDPNKPYTFYVVPDIGSMPSNVTSYPSATITLVAPVWGTVSAPDLNSVDFNWTYAGTADSFQIYVSVDDENGTYAALPGGLISSGTQTSASVPYAMQTGSNYFFRIAPIVGGVEGNWSAAARVSHGPAAPTNAAATVQADGSVVLTWDASPSADGYIITRREATETGDGALVTTITSGTIETYTDPNPPAGVSLIYKVRSYVNGSGGPVSGDAMDTNAVTVPIGKVQNVVGTADTAGINGTTLTWDAVPGIARYDVYFGTDATTPTLLTSVTGGVTSLQIDPTTHASIAYGQNYYYTVRAVAADAAQTEGVPSDPAGPLAMLMAPMNLTATPDAAAGTIELSWQADEAMTAPYDIMRAESATGPWTKVGEALGTDTSYSDSDSLVAGTRYYYQVKAMPATHGKDSIVADAVAGSTSSDLPAPTNFAAEPKSGSHDTIELSWDAVAGAEGYFIRRFDSVTNTTEILEKITDPTATSYEDNTVLPALRFTYTINAYKVDGGVDKEGAASTDDAMIVPSSPDPLEVKLAADYSGLVLTWTPVPGAAGYAINAHTSSPVPSDQANTITTTTNEWAQVVPTAANGLEYGKTYYFVVYPLFVYDGRTFRNPNYHSSEESGTLLLSVTDLAAKATSATTVELTWEADANPSGGFIIARSTSETGTFIQVGTVTGDKRAFEDKNLTPDTDYFYIVAPMPEEIGRDSEVVKVHTPAGTTDPGKPTGVTATPTAIDSIQVRWTAVSGAKAYIVERAGGTSTAFAEVGKTEGTTLTDSSCVINTTYQYRVVPVVDDGTNNETRGTASDVVTAAIPFTLYNQVTASRDGTSRITLSWNRVPFATHVQIERADSQTSTYKAIKTLAGTGTTATNINLPLTYTDTGLTAGKTYYYRVTPLYASTTKTVYGIPGEVSERTNRSSSSGSGSGSSTATRDAATGLTAQQTGFTTIGVSWNAQANAAGVVLSRSIGNGNFAEIADLPSGTTSYEDTGAMPTPDEVRYRITPYTMSGTQRKMGTASNAIAVSNALGAVPAVKVDSDPSGMGTILSWNAVSGATEYHVFVRGVESAPWQLLGVTYGQQNTSFLSEGQEASGSYRYFVQAMARPSLSGNASYAATAKYGATLARRPQGDWMLAFMNPSNQAASVSFTSADAGGQKAIGLTYHDAEGFALTGVSTASSGSAVAVWPLNGEDIIESDMRTSAASKIVP